MSNCYDRGSKVLIREAELLSASNDFIYKFYHEKIHQSEKRFFSDMDEQVEANLLLKNDPFIDILLAQHCIFEDTIFKLFSKAVLSNDCSLKFACLSNEFVGEERLAPSLIPSVLFGENELRRQGDCPNLLNWLKSASEIEVELLFKNKAIDRRWLTSLLKCENEFWAALGEQRQILAIRSLSQNPIIEFKHEIGFFTDGYDNFLFNELFNVIWDLPAKVPTTRAWAHVLGLLLDNVIDGMVSCYNCADIAKRWMSIEQTSNDETDEIWLNPYEIVRFHLYVHTIKGSYGKKLSNEEHFENPDRAYRACAYRNLRLKSDDLLSAYTRDGVFAVNYMLMNENLWKLVETRDALRNLCDESDEKSHNPEFGSVYNFRSRKRFFEKLHPTWFDESSDDDKALNLGLMRNIIRELKEDLSNSLSPWKHDLGIAFKLIEFTFYMAIFTSAMLMVLRFSK